MSTPLIPATKKKRKSFSEGSSNSSSPTKAEVQYETLLSDVDPDKPLTEFVELGQIRPVHPDDNVDRLFEPGDKVDAFHLDAWWPGVVIKREEDEYTEFHLEGVLKHNQSIHVKVPKVIINYNLRIPLKIQSKHLSPCTDKSPYGETKKKLKMSPQPKDDATMLCLYKKLKGGHSEDSLSLEKSFPRRTPVKSLNKESPVINVLRSVGQSTWDLKGMRGMIYSHSGSMAADCTNDIFELSMITRLDLKGEKHNGTGVVAQVESTEIAKDKGSEDAMVEEEACTFCNGYR